MNSERRLLLRRTFAYASLPLLSTLTPFVVLPVISRACTTAEWSALAIGQSIGMVGSLVVSYGWPVVGPARAAQTGIGQRGDLYAMSLSSRLTILAVCGPIVCLLAWFGAPEGISARSLCVLMSVNGILIGMSISWYCIGTGIPGAIARYEVVPRVLASLVATAAVLFTGWLWVYPSALIVATALGVMVFSRKIRTHRRSKPLGETDGLLVVLRRQTAPTMVELSAGSYTMGGSFLASTVASPLQIAHYSSADRLNQVAMQGIVAISNALSPWVAESRGRQFARRARLAVLTHGALGVFGLLGLAVLGPWASGFLFGERFAAGPGTCAAFGVYFFAVSMQTALSRHILVSRGRVSPVLVGTLIGAAVGVPAVLLGAHAFGATGAASGLAAGELLICLVTLGPALRTVRRHSSGEFDSVSSSSGPLSVEPPE